VSRQPISTCAQGSGASPSPRKPPGSKRSRSAKANRDASVSSDERGASRSTPTSQNSTVGATGELALSLEDSPANQRAEPGNNSARMMTAGSGMKVSAFLPNHGRMALFSRTLLGSSIWRSTEYLLRWQVMGVPRVIAETYLLVQDEQSSTRSWQKFERSITRSSHLLFRLAPWTAPSSGSDSGLSDSWPTPTSDADRNRTKPYAQGGTPLNMLVNLWPSPQARDEKGQTQNADRPDAVPNLVHGTWPTPRAEDSESTGAHRGKPDTLTSAAKATWAAPTATDQTRSTPETDDDKRARGANPGKSLIDQIATATWPTPQAHQGPNKGENRGALHGGKRPRITPQNPGELIKAWPTPRNNTGEDESTRHLSVGGAIRSWPTPNASDGSGGASDPTTRKKNEAGVKHSTQLPDYIGSPTSGPLAAMGSFVERLTNLSMWLMGYTAQYLRHWETRSSRKPRSQSSTPCAPT
jgi:hypothetical protein